VQKRLEFHCWNCEQTYSLLLEIDEDKPQLWVACPFCHKEAIVDLDPYRKPVDKIYRGKSSSNDNSGETDFDLPDILPTRPKS